jgi:hypothetical protein
MQWDLRRAVPWPLRAANAAEGPPRQSHRPRAIISWNSATEESAMSKVVQNLQARFPEAEISVRRR